MLDVFFAKFLRGPEGKFSQDKGAYSGADQLCDAESEGVEHEANLTFEAGFEHDGQSPRGDPFAVFGPRLSNFWNVNSFDELKKDFGLVVLVDGDLVFLFQLFGRMGQFLSKVAVIGEDEKTFRVEVESAYVFEVVILVGQ